MISQDNKTLRMLSGWDAGSRFRRLIGSLVPVGVLAMLLVAWQLATEAASSPFFPPPTEIATSAKTLWFSGPAHKLFLTDQFLDNALPSLQRLFVGWGLAVVIGIALGAVLGMMRGLADYVTPIVEFLRSVPPPALLPIFLIAFGATASMRVWFIAFGSVWFILINTIAGVRTVDPLQIETGRAFSIGWASRVFRIILPSAAPKAFAGLRLSLSAALILMVISELVAATDGIGFELIQAQRSFAIKSMWAGIVLLGILGSGLNAVLAALERRVLAWHRGARDRNDE